MPDQMQELYEQYIALRKRMTDLLRSEHQIDLAEDYTLRRAGDGDEVNLSELFGERDELIVVHNMGKSCPYCTLWADGLVSLLPHLESRAPFVVVSPDPPDVQREFAQSRGWTFPMLSAQGTTFIADMGFEPKPGSYMPGYSTFLKRDDGSIQRFAMDYFGPGDHYNAAWHFFDMLPKGVNGWQPKFAY